MKLFSRKKSNKQHKCPVTVEDKEWVEECFAAFIHALGYPSKNQEQLLLSAENFPKSFSSANLDVQLLIDDICALLDFDKQLISFEIQEDLFSSTTPFAKELDYRTTELQSVSGGYKLIIESSTAQRRNQLLFFLIRDLIEVKLDGYGLIDELGNTSEPYLLVAGIYFRFGVILAQRKDDTGKTSDGIMESSWAYYSPMPDEVMGFSLATFLQLLGKDKPSWSQELPNRIEGLFEASMTYYTTTHSVLYNEETMRMDEILREAHSEYETGDIQAAITSYKQYLFVAQESWRKANAYNFIGYAQIRLGAWERGIVNFDNALKHDREIGIAYDNKAYALLQLGKVDEAKRQLDNAQRSEYIDPAYTARNLALYSIAIGEMDQAEALFQEAYSLQKVHVDCLDLEYGQFLVSQGKKDEGMAFIQKAADFGEDEALDFLKKMDT